MANLDIFSDALTETVRTAGIEARKESLRAGLPVFYRDAKTGVNIMERPDGRRFHIRFIEGAARGRNYEIVCELGASAA